MNDVEMSMEDSMDGGPPSVGSGEIPVLIQNPGTNIPATPVTTKKVCFLWILLFLINMSYDKFSDLFSWF